MPRLLAIFITGFLIFNPASADLRASISALNGFDDLKACAKSCLTGYYGTPPAPWDAIGCGTENCMCRGDNLDAEGSVLVSCMSDKRWCSGNPNDIYSGASVFSAFCKKAAPETSVTAAASTSTATTLKPGLVSTTILISPPTVTATKIVTTGGQTDTVTRVLVGSTAPQAITTAEAAKQIPGRMLLLALLSAPMLASLLWVVVG